MLWKMVKRYAAQVQILLLSQDDDKGTLCRDMDESSQGPRRSRSRRCSSSIGDPTKYKQARMTPPPGRPVASAAVKLRPPFGSKAVSRPGDEDYAVGPEKVVETADSSAGGLFCRPKWSLATPPH
jgi:hypothetical protein